MHTYLRRHIRAIVDINKKEDISTEKLKNLLEKKKNKKVSDLHKLKIYTQKKTTTA